MSINDKVAILPQIMEHIPVIRQDLQHLLTKFPEAHVKVNNLLDTCTLSGTGPAWSMLKLREVYWILKGHAWHEQAQMISMLANSIAERIKPNNFAVKEFEKLKPFGVNELDIGTALMVQASLQGTLFEDQLKKFALRISEEKIPLYSLLWPFEDLLRLVPYLTVVNFNQPKHSIRPPLSPQEMRQLIEAATAAKEMSFTNHKIDHMVPEGFKNTRVERLSIKWCELNNAMDFTFFRSLNSLEISDSIGLQGNIDLSSSPIKELAVLACDDFTGALIFPEGAKLTKVEVRDCSEWAQELNINFSDLQFFALCNCDKYPEKAPLDFSIATQLVTLELSMGNWQGALSLPPKGLLEQVKLDGSEALAPEGPWDFSGHPYLVSFNAAHCDAFNTPLIFGNHKNFNSLNLQNCRKYNQQIVMGSAARDFMLNDKNCKAWTISTKIALNVPNDTGGSPSIAEGAALPLKRA